jgi:hypothetical protein
LSCALGANSCIACTRASTVTDEETATAVAAEAAAVEAEDALKSAVPMLLRLLARTTLPPAAVEMDTEAAASASPASTSIGIANTRSAPRATLWVVGLGL